MPTFLVATEEEPGQAAGEARKTLDDEVGRMQASDGTVAQAHLRLGGAPEEEVALAEDMGAGLILMGSRVAAA